MFKKLLSAVLVSIMALSLVGFNWFGGGTNKASNYSDADFKDHFYCYVDGSGILHFTSNKNKGKFSLVKIESGCSWGNKDGKIDWENDLETYHYVVENEWFNNVEEITIDDKILINFGGLFYDKSKLKKINNIENIVTTDLLDMFRGCESLETLDLSKMDVSHVKSMRGTFGDCTNLKSLNVNNWDTSSVASMDGTFGGCKNLTNLNVNNWNTRNVTSMWGTFSGCSSLTALDIGNWDVSNVTNMHDMFKFCENLTTLNIENWNVSNVKYMSDTFSACYKLTVIPSWYDKNKK